MKAATSTEFGCAKISAGRPICSIAPFHEDRHAIGQRHRLFLVVGDVDRGDAERALQLLAARRASRAAAWRRGSTAARRAGTAAACARWRAPARSAAAARPRAARAAVEQVIDVDLARRVPHRGLDLRLGDLRHFQRKGDVLGHRHVRIERVALEHHRDVALAGSQRGDVLAVDQDAAGGRRCRARRGCAASWSCPNPTARAGRRTRPARSSRSIPCSAVKLPCRLTMPSKRTCPRMLIGALRP